MNTYIGYDSNIHSIARGLLVQGDQIILCKGDGGDHFFLPGGHIEDGEPAKVALERELHEELVDTQFKIEEFLGACESIFEVSGGSQHEINLVFRVDFDEEIEVISAEEHLEFTAVPKDELQNYQILPKTLKAGLVEWFSEKEVFFKEARDSCCILVR